jgi:hypothetical protein
MAPEVYKSVITSNVSGIRAYGTVRLRIDSKEIWNGIGARNQILELWLTS